MYIILVKLEGLQSHPMPHVSLSHTWDNLLYFICTDPSVPAPRGSAPCGVIMPESCVSLFTEINNLVLHNCVKTIIASYKEKQK